MQTSNILNLAKIFKVSFFDFNKVQFLAISILISIVSFFLCNFLAFYLKFKPILYLGLILIFFFMQFVSVAVVKMLKADMLKESPVNYKEAFLFLKKHAITIIFTPLLVLLSILIIIGLEMLFSLVIFIPYIGPLLITFLTIPVMIVNVVLLIIISIGSFLVNSIIAVEETNCLETLNIVYKTCKKEPLKIAFYFGILFLIGFAIFLFPILVFVASIFFTFVLWLIPSYWTLFPNAYFDPNFFLMLPFWYWLINFFFIAVMSSLILALPLTYLYSICTQIYLAFRK